MNMGPAPVETLNRSVFIGNFDSTGFIEKFERSWFPKKLDWPKNFGKLDRPEFSENWIDQNFLKN